MHSIFRSSCLLGVVLLSACGLPLRQAAPLSPVVPTAWQNAQTGNATPATDAPWWQAVGDQGLSALIEQALAANRDLSRSALRLQQAALQAHRSSQDRLPRLQAGVSAGSQRPLDSSGSAGTVIINGQSVPVVNNVGTTSSASASVSASYEIDLWGRIANNITLADQAVGVAQADAETARWLISTQVAEQYWTLAALDAKAPLLRANSADALASLAATRLRLEVGKARPIELDRAQSTADDAKAREATLASQRAQAQLTLALLLDEAPQGYAAGPATLPVNDPPDWSTPAPASVLDRRPELRSARINLDSALLKLHFAQANRYPTFSLSATVNSGGNALHQWLSNPVGSLSLGLALPMLDWQRLKDDQDIAKLQLQDVAIQFKDSLHKALQEVDKQLVERRQSRADLAQGRAKLALADRALTLAQTRHAQGAEALQTVRDAQTSQREAAISLLDLRAKAWLGQTALQKALGGPV
jgi:NodT family efflux transporter outer membrane factor (OMF) lipoprotein